MKGRTWERSVKTIAYVNTFFNNLFIKNDDVSKCEKKEEENSSIRQSTLCFTFKAQTLQ